MSVYKSRVLKTLRSLAQMVRASHHRTLYLRLRFEIHNKTNTVLQLVARPRGCYLRPSVLLLVKDHPYYDLTSLVLIVLWFST